MRLFVERGNRIVSVDDSGAAVAVTDRSNILADSVELFVDEGVERIVTWSGTMGESLEGASPLNWTGPGRESFDAFCDAVAGPLAEAELTLLVQPHAQHVISDIPSCIWFLKRCEDRPFELALSPATMLTPSMLDTIDDWLLRAFETLGPHASMLFLHDVQPAIDDIDEDRLNLAPLGRGAMPRDLCGSLIREHCPPAIPIVVIDEEIGDQRAWLGAV